MAKIRVHELAKELGLSSKEMVNILQDMGIDVKNHMSTMEDSQVIWVKKQLKPVEDKTQIPEGENNDVSVENRIRPDDRPEQPHTSYEKKGKRDVFPSASAPNVPLSAQEDNREKSGVAGQNKQNNMKPKRDGKGNNMKERNKKPEKRLGDRDLIKSDSVEIIDYSDKIVDEEKIGGKIVKIKPTKFKKDETKVEVRKDYSRPQKKSKHKKKKEDDNKPTPEIITIEDNITVRELAEKLNKTPAEIVKKLMELGTMASINQVIDFDTAEIVASLYEVKVQREIPEEEKLLQEIVDDESQLKPRPPVVTVMGHVDHGKTSLLDRIRKSNVALGEAGGITQHIGAYQVNINDSKITFIDTPGHEAFTAMRARGANVTDIVVLVVAADDGVMPQTVEAINHIRAAGVPFIVAVNKIDKPEANPERVMQQLTEYNIVPEEWGGDTIFVPVSAKTGQGIDNLLEMILLVAEMQELKANPDRPAEGVVIESKLDKGRGPVATVLVQKGTLHVGDCLVCGSNMCKVRAMMDDKGRRVEKALPSMPVEVMGWSDVPEAGGKVIACDEKIAKQIVELRLNEKKLEEQKKSSRVSLDEFFKHMQDAEVKELNVIIKGDVQGSIEALSQSLQRLSTDEVKVNVIHAAVGAISETDVMLASASNAIIIGFNVRPESKARKHAEEEGIDVRLYRVIYEVIDDVKKAMAGLLEPEYREKYLGRAEVRATFRVPNVGIVAGCYVVEGKIQRNANVRVLRDGVVVYEGVISSLKRFKDDVREVAENYECGIGIKDFNDIKVNDIIEAYTLEEVPRQL
ncbi:bacterial translation initiation factor 2 (bIF-2) [Thermosyntropha lipolytica DSM 11003]|uniref:Translation initiation factor IF-2 n=1 Tax=Thermosyntropha lipolytica DSM 11003 TaxID=1123382 RepID=A0A1M5KVK3_9FIRM|nr:translation initiation factor IF-2 [Thermosyntropha lipolytica]SHG56811.1 bacterial translation initiation factor 2 (bIF-2) [Thermosyntropha lipolytica DSM 11003]